MDLNWSCICTPQSSIHHQHSPDNPPDVTHNLPDSAQDVTFSKSKPHTSLASSWPRLWCDLTETSDVTDIVRRQWHRSNHDKDYDWYRPNRYARDVIKIVIFTFRICFMPSCQWHLMPALYGNSRAMSQALVFITLYIGQQFVTVHLVNMCTYHTFDCQGIQGNIGMVWNSLKSLSWPPAITAITAGRHTLT